MRYISGQPVHQRHFLSPGLLVLLRELSDFDCEGHRARSQDVDDAEVPELDVEAELLEEPAVPAGRHLGLILAVGAGAGDLARGPHRGRRVRAPQFHGHHLQEFEFTVLVRNVSSPLGGSNQSL